MLFCDRPNLDKWSPELSASGQASPEWTRVTHGRIALCNSLEWTDWTTNSVQVELCGSCGTPGCGSGGYVHISALTDLVLWTQPCPDNTSERFATTSIERFGSIAFPRGVWQTFRSAARRVPDFEMIPLTDGIALGDAWVAGPGRPKVANELLPWLRGRLMGADTLEPALAIEWAEYWLAWFQQRGGVSIGAVVKRADEVGGLIEKFYFDGPAAEDWPALAQYRGSYVPALRLEHVLVPE